MLYFYLKISAELLFLKKQRAGGGFSARLECGKSLFLISQNGGGIFSLHQKANFPCIGGKNNRFVMFYVNRIASVTAKANIFSYIMYLNKK